MENKNKADWELVHKMIAENLPAEPTTEEDFYAKLISLGMPEVHQDDFSHIISWYQEKQHIAYTEDGRITEFI